MSNTWTKEQSDAIRLRHTGLLVSASAGSGKTAVLVERILELMLKDRVEINRMLIVTFTNGAAMEMRNRIREAIYQKLRVIEEETKEAPFSPEQMKEETYLRRQLTLLNQSYISTIHAFCLGLIRQNFQKLNLDPLFRMGNEGELSILREEALEEVLETAYDQGDAAFLDLADTYGGNKTDKSLGDMILRIYGAIQGQVEPYAWLDEKASYFDTEGKDDQDFAEHIWMKTLTKQCKVDLTLFLTLLEEAIEKCNLPGGPIEYLSTLEEEKDFMERLLLEEDEKDLLDQVTVYSFPSLNRAGKEVNPDLKKEVQDIRNTIKKSFKGYQQTFDYKKVHKSREDLRYLYPMIASLVSLVKGFYVAYQNKKLEKNVLDFNDLEHFAYRLLKEEAVSRKYKEQFQYIFVDEYQDTNLLQEAIIEKIKRDDNLFMVGDVKQSIYSFRSAEPSLFLKKFHTYAPLEQKTKETKINLNHNFRSGKNVISFVNLIFSEMMTEGVSGIDYEKDAMLKAGREKIEMEHPKTELCVLETGTDAENGEEYQSGIEKEAFFMVSKIKELLREKIYDEKEKMWRAVTYRDIVILLRSVKDYSDVLEKMLAKEAIPVFTDKSGGYLSSIEIGIFLNLLKIIDNRRQDIPLLSVMRSPMFQFRAEDFAAIRQEGEGKTFYDALLFYTENAEGFLKEKCQDFLEQISRYQEISRYEALETFLWRLMEETGYYDIMGAFQDGGKRQANLLFLLHQAAEFENTSTQGLFHFIRYLENTEKNGQEGISPKELSEEDNVVRIMTIHKSKGLQFPIVLLGGTGKKLNLTDTKGNLLLHKRLGFGPEYINDKLRVKRDSIGKKAIRYQIRLENIAEELRLLYVAMTRAESKIVITGAVKELEKSLKKWNQRICDYRIFNASCYLDLICPPVFQESKRKIREKGIYETSHAKVEIKNYYEDRREGSEETRMAEEQFYAAIEIKLKQISFEEECPKEVQTLAKDYPYPDAANIPSKVSVTGLKRIKNDQNRFILMNQETITERPKFMTDKLGLFHAEMGTVLHRALQFMDFNRVEEEEEIKKQIREMTEKELLTPLMEEEILKRYVPNLLSFYQSTIGKRMIQAKKVYREAGFNLKLPVCEVFPEIICPKEEYFLVQGIIDCYFEEEGAYVLLDYKSGYVLKGRKVKEEYRAQIKMYEKALEALTKKKVKESYIYAIDTNTFYKI